MSFRPLTDTLGQSNDCGDVASQTIGSSGGARDAIETLLAAAQSWNHTTSWVVYRAGEQMHRVGQGDPQVQ